MAKQKQVKSPEDIINELEAENAQNFSNLPEAPEQQQNEQTQPLNSQSNESAGKYQLLSGRKQENDTLDAIDTTLSSNMVGMKMIPMESLPSKGLFYPIGFSVGIKAATVSEVRQWATIDENDPIDMNDKMNLIMEKCVRVSCSSGNYTWKDIKEMDRTSLLIKVHEITFPDGENQLMIPFECECKNSFNVPLSSNIIGDFFKPSDELMRFYDSSKRCFVIDSQKIGSPIEMYPPSLGAMHIVLKKAKSLREEGKNMDPSVIRCMQYFMPNWRTWNDANVDDKFSKFNANMIMWSMAKFQSISWLADEFQKSNNLDVVVECPQCGEELKKSIFFRGGYTLKDFFCAKFNPSQLL